MKLTFKNLWSGITQITGEIKARWGAASPYLFKIIQRLAVFFAFLAGIPAAVQAAGVELHGTLAILADKAIVISAITAYIVAKLPVDTGEATKKVLKKIQNKDPE